MGGLKQVLDTDSDTVAVKPRAIKPSHEVVETVRHLTAQDFKDYASGQLTPARLEHCQSHLDSCEDCRSELEELRTFKDDFATFPRPEPNRGVLRKQRPGITLPWAAALVIVLVAGVTTVFWWKHESSAGTKNPAVAAVTQVPAVATEDPAAVGRAPAQAAQAPPQVAQTPAVVARAQIAPARAAVAHAPVQVAPAATTLARAPAQVTSAATAVARGAAPATPTPAAAAARKAAAPPTSAQASAPVPENRVFALLGPLGPTISDLRPEFTWQELPGALHYSVVIVDARLRPVQHSSALHATSWRPKHPLHHGRTYMWQVTATIHGGHKVPASAPATITEAK
jgi:hypothetical protein